MGRPFFVDIARNGIVIYETASILLVLALYSPKPHRLTFLRSQIERLASRLIAAWPRDKKFVRRCFTRLDRAYVGGAIPRPMKSSARI